MIELRHAHDAARAIAGKTLGNDPGQMTLTQSSSHSVYVGSDVVVKLIGASEHSRLERAIALAPDLPVGLTATLLDSGLHSSGSGDVRYACYRRVPGVVPGIGMPGVDEAIALRWAAEAVQRLGELHSWSPAARAEQTLREPLDHGGFVSRDKLIADVGRIAVEDRTGLVSRSVVEGLAGIAEHAPLEARTVVPVHADCHWGNWLVGDHGVTALLDFEWARFGEPVDDWFFLARFSGLHRDSVLGIVSDATTKSRDELRAECEVREAAYLTSDLLVALRSQDATSRVALEILRDLENLVVNRTWWRSAG